MRKRSMLETYIPWAEARGDKAKRLPGRAIAWFAEKNRGPTRWPFACFSTQTVAKLAHMGAVGEGCAG